MNYVIIPDIHTKIVKLNKILHKYPHHQPIILGDFFDDFHDTPIIAKEVALCVKYILEETNIIAILGNHDYHYWKPTLQRCSGFTWQKQEAIRSVLNENHFEKMKTHVWVEGFLISHAGYSNYYTHPVKGLTPEITEGWDKKVKESHAANKLPELFWCGQDRFGTNHHSGPIWQDWNTLKKVEGVNQIVGHTPYHAVREHKGDYCLDTHLNHVALLENGEIKIKKVNFNERRES